MVSYVEPYSFFAHAKDECSFLDVEHGLGGYHRILLDAV